MNDRKDPSLDYYRLGWQGYTIPKFTVEQMGALLTAFRQENQFHWYSLLPRYYVDKDRRGDYELLVVQNISCYNDEEYIRRNGGAKYTDGSLEKQLEETGDLAKISFFIKGFHAALKDVEK